MITFLEGILQATAESTEDDFDAGFWTKAVATFDGPTTIELSPLGWSSRKPVTVRAGPC